MTLVRPLLSVLLTVAVSVVVTPAWGHLLNMTEARLSLEDDGQINLLLDIDLLRSTNSPTAYHELAIDPYDPAYAELWQRMADAIVLKQGEQRIFLKVTGVTAADDLTLANFENPFVWPKLRVQLAGKLGVPAPPEAALQAIFTSGFIFEEPVALTMTDSRSGAKKSRWLVTDQPSPVFYTRGTDQQAAGFDMATVLEAARHGVFHILPAGFDHLLFLLALVLSIRQKRELIVTISLFTVAHSLTLALATMRIVEMPPTLVELAILASIAWVAAQALLDKSTRQSYLVIVFFGLMHGLGFANAFRAEAGTDAFLWRLLGFNIGIEIAQLTFVMIALGCTNLLRRYVQDMQRVLRHIAAVILAMVCFWALRILFT